MLKERVLIIDNDTIWLDAAVQTFNQFGYEAYGALDTEAAKVLPDCDYALIDLIMPGSEGTWISFTAWLKDHGSTTKCFVISSHENELNEAEKSGADTILKPLSMEELVQIFEARIKSEHFIDATGAWVKRFQKMVDRASQQMDVAIEKMMNKTTQHQCVHHAGFQSEISSISKEIEAQERRNIDSRKEIWGAIDKMRASVTGAAWAFILACVAWILSNFHLLPVK